MVNSSRPQASSRRGCERDGIDTSCTDIVSGHSIPSTLDLSFATTSSSSTAVQSSLATASCSASGSEKRPSVAPVVRVPEKRLRIPRATKDYVAQQSSWATPITAPQQVPAKKTAVKKKKGGPAVIKATGAEGEKTASSLSQKGKATSGTAKARSKKVVAATNAEKLATVKASIDNKRKKNQADDASVRPRMTITKASRQADAGAGASTNCIQTRSRAKARGMGGPKKK